MTSAFRRCMTGSKRRWEMVATARPRWAASATIASASASDSASGFSTTTCLPLRRAASACSRVQARWRADGDRINVVASEQLVDVLRPRHSPSLSGFASPVDRRARHDGQTRAIHGLDVPRGAGSTRRRTRPGRTNCVGQLGHAPGHRGRCPWWRSTGATRSSAVAVRRKQRQPRPKILDGLTE